MQTTYEFHGFRLDADEPRLLCEGQVLRLPPTALRILVVLVRLHGQAVTAETLVREALPAGQMTERALGWSIAALRRVLGEAAGRSYIEIVPRRGYRFVAPVVEHHAAAHSRRAQQSPVASASEPSAMSRAMGLWREAARLLTRGA